MSHATLNYTETKITKELIKQIRALDTYDVLDGQSDAETLDPFIMTKERRRQMPIVGDPDEIVMARVKAFYNAIATSIENACGLMAVPMLKVSHEGFGRVLITVGKLVVLDRSLRDLHRFGFPSLEALNEQADRMIGDALMTIESYDAAAKA